MGTARYDKYDGKTGGFRAQLADKWDDADVGVPVGVSLDANGRLVKGAAGQSGLVGVFVDDGERLRTGLEGSPAGKNVDVMTAGDIVNVEDLDAGTSYFLGADGSVGDSGLALGHTVAADHLVVRFQKGASA